MKYWAVVQDLRPWGLRVEGRYRFHWRARFKAAGSRYWDVLPLDYVDAENARLEDPEEIMRDVAARSGIPFVSHAQLRAALEFPEVSGDTRAAPPEGQP